MSEGMWILLICLGGGAAISLIAGRVKHKEPTGNFSSVSPGYGPEYRDDRANRFILRNCQRWPRMQEVNAVSHGQHVSLLEAAVIVSQKYGEPLPPRLATMAQERGFTGVTGQADWIYEQPTAEQYPDIVPVDMEGATIIVDGITMKSDRYGFPADGWPVAQPTQVEIPARVKK